MSFFSGTRRAMVSQCSNPSCRRPLSALSEGRLYQFEIVSISISAVDSSAEDLDETPQRQAANFWLCSQCSLTMTLSLEPQEGLKLVPIEEERSAMPESRDLPSPGEAHDC